MRILLLCAVSMQFLAWVYDPGDVIPHTDVVTAHKQFSGWLRSFPGDVFVPAHSEEAVRAGKAWHPDTASLHDALRASNPAVRQSLLTEIQTAVDEEKFDAIALDGRPEQALASQPWLPRDLRQHYPVVGLVPGGEIGDPFGPHPVYFLLPCREQALALQKNWTLVSQPGQFPCPATAPGERPQTPR